MGFLTFAAAGSRATRHVAVSHLYHRTGAAAREALASREKPAENTYQQQFFLRVDGPL